MANTKKLNRTFLINEELLKLHSPISKNVSVDKLVPFLNLAQPYYIEPILGKALTNELITQIESNTLTTENKALIIELAPALSLWSTYLAVRALGYSFTEKGATKEHSENSESLNEKEMGQYILSIKNQAEMGQKLLIRYLCECQDLYPLWRPSTPCDCNEYFTESQSSGSTKQTLKFSIYLPYDTTRKKQCGCN